MSNLLPLYLKNHNVGKVHSKFTNGFNIQFDNFLIYVGRLGTPLTAFGLNIEEEKLKYLLNCVRSGDLVVNKGDKLIFYSGCGALTICYKDLEQIDLKLPEIKCTVKEISYSRIYQYLETIEFEKFIGIELDEKTGKYIELLLHSDKTAKNVNSMIINFFAGRGKGLTPSGDDILIGFTLALMVFGQFNIWKNALTLEVTSDKTTLVSVAYLIALLAGYTSEHFIRLVKLVDNAESVALEKTINEVRSFGHTSGNDTLFGFFLGLKFLINQGKE
ncbi:MAG: hypothetical protein H6Q72_460 [Firmicutes bacterium]|nr:hypothetical protein [Bacillota bacterium]